VFVGAGVGDEEAVVKTGSVLSQCLVDQDGDFELDALPHWKPVQLAENWRDAVASLSVRQQSSGSVLDRLEAVH